MKFPMKTLFVFVSYRNWATVQFLGATALTIETIDYDSRNGELNIFTSPLKHETH